MLNEKQLDEFVDVFCEIVHGDKLMGVGEVNMARQQACEVINAILEKAVKDRIVYASRDFTDVKSHYDHAVREIEGLLSAPSKMPGVLAWAIGRLKGEIMEGTLKWPKDDHDER